MKSFKSTAVAAVTPERLWSIIADVVRWPEWTPTMTSVEPLGPPALTVGAMFKVRQPNLRPAVWRVTAVEPNQSFTWVSKSPGVSVVAHHRVQPIGADQSAIELEIVFLGVFAPLIAMMVGKLTQSYLETEATSLKQRVEST